LALVSMPTEADPITTTARSAPAIRGKIGVVALRSSHPEYPGDRFSRGLHFTVRNSWNLRPGVRGFLNIG
jgi:hypothetical protein